jgi:TonB family protein
MMEAWWAVVWSAAWKGSMVLALAGVAAVLLRRSSASLRHAVWVAALFVVVLLVLTAALPWTGTAPAMAADSLVIRVAAGSRVAPANAPGSAAIYWAVWLGVSAILLARLAVAHVHVYRAARSARRIDTLPNGAAVLEGAAGSMPVCWGFLRRVVFLPPESAHWKDVLRASVLKHESAHLDRGDCWWHLFARVVASLLWFHPLVWWAVWRIGEESERASDDAVLREGADAADYAGHLVSVARCLRASPAAALAVVRPSRLEARVKAVLSGEVRRGSVGRAGALALALAAFVVLLPLGAARNVGEEDEKVYSIREGDGVKPPSVIHKVEPQMTPEAREAKVEGSVLLSIEVDTQGIARNIKVTKHMEYGLTESAIVAVNQWRFKPGLKDGKPVRVKATIQINFRQ